MKQRYTLKDHFYISLAKARYIWLAVRKITVGDFSLRKDIEEDVQPDGYVKLRPISAYLAIELRRYDET